MQQPNATHMTHFHSVLYQDFILSDSYTTYLLCISDSFKSVAGQGGTRNYCTLLWLDHMHCVYQQSIIGWCELYAHTDPVFWSCRQQNGVGRRQIWRRDILWLLPGDLGQDGGPEKAAMRSLFLSPLSESWQEIEGNNCVSHMQVRAYCVCLLLVG